MSLAPKLQLKQTQTIAPQLVQSLKVLQLSGHDLINYVNDQLTSNPVLENQTDIDCDAELNNPSRQSAKEKNAHVAGDSKNGHEFVNSYDGHYGKSNWSSDDKANWLANVPSPQLSLQEHLSQQLRLSTSDKQQLTIGMTIIDNIDEAGYLNCPCEQLAQLSGCRVTAVRAVVKLIQKFDPTGVGARNLGECLALQLRERNQLTPAMARLLTRLDLIAKAKFGELANYCQIDIPQLKKMLQLIKSLNPRPGNAYASNVSQHIMPDIIIVHNNNDGNIHINLNNSNLPALAINKNYLRQITANQLNNQINKETSEFIAQHMNAASHLIKSIEQRSATIIKVASAIVKIQHNFFFNGIKSLKPMTMKKIAAMTGLHESTISRTVNNKYLSCDQGVFALKFFFSAAIAAKNHDDEAYSAKAIRSLIKNIIASETPNNIISDQSLTDILLHKHGINIARRTVAKYRELLYIPSSAKRKRQYNLSVNTTGKQLLKAV